MSLKLIFYIKQLFLNAKNRLIDNPLYYKFLLVKKQCMSAENQKLPASDRALSGCLLPFRAATG
ncbi:MAG: hypothetical protein ABIC82_04655 [bacterium]